MGFSEVMRPACSEFNSHWVRRNQRGRLPHDAPNRVLVWGIVGLPRKLEFVPALDVHTGFPYSKLDPEWQFIGKRNEAGRFPIFFGLDVMLQYPFDFTFRTWHFKFRAGLKVYNVFNHFNPRDVQQHVGSPNFGGFYNSVGRLFRLESAFDF